MKRLSYIYVFLFFVLGCTSDSIEGNKNSLEAYTANRNVEKRAVIACAASDAVTNAVLAFYYPEDGATDVRYFETLNADGNKEDFSSYEQIELQNAPFFNGYLGKFTRVSSNEKWIIITFELDGEIKMSNPIRTKQIVKPSIWSDNVSINQETTMMPRFEWQKNAFGDNAIYFQIISDVQDNLLSGTYTFENQFQYYNTANVVLNITTQTPPNLLVGTSYNFTLMDVSEDNWVNTVIQKTFVAQ